MKVQIRSTAGGRRTVGLASGIVLTVDPAPQTIDDPKIAAKVLAQASHHYGIEVKVIPEPKPAAEQPKPNDTKPAEKKPDVKKDSSPDKKPGGGEK